MKTKAPVVHSDPEILGGTPVFVGTRVPVKSLYDYLEAGDSLDECVPRPLKRELAIHDVHHVVDLGWSSKELRPLVPAILLALSDIAPGELAEVGVRSSEPARRPRAADS